MNRISDNCLAQKPFKIPLDYCLAPKPLNITSDYCLAPKRSDQTVARPGAHLFRELTLNTTLFELKNGLLWRTDLGFSWELVYSLKNNTFKEGVPLSLLLVSLDDSLKTL